MSNVKSRFLLDQYQILYDGQKDGYDSSGASAIFVDGQLYLLFQKASDAAKGLHPLLTISNDLGKSWTKPEPFGPDIVKQPDMEYLGLTLCGPSPKGTLFCIGVHLEKGIREDEPEAYNDLKWRPGTAIIGRKEKGEKRFTYQYYKPGAFLIEQFGNSGIFLAGGRIMMSFYGSNSPAENWRCGVLVSDDDGLTWRYIESGYESDLSIRKDPEMPAGFNEQSLFESKDGDIVSLIRGRENLGMVEDSPKDTWFFRTVSKDQGETWSTPEITDIAGTGASSYGITLPDGSLLHACRIPYARKMYALPAPDAYGLHIARSYDKGITWETELLVQKDPYGTIFNNYYNTMNGQFVCIGENEWMYVFGQFGHVENIHKVLMVKFHIS